MTPVTRRRRAWFAALSVGVLLVLAAVGAACGAGAETSQGGAASSPASSASPLSAEAERLQAFMKDQQRVMDAASEATELERQASSAMQDALQRKDYDACVAAAQRYVRAAEAYRQVADQMRALDVPPGLETFGDLVKAQADYASALDRAWGAGPTSTSNGPAMRAVKELGRSWLGYRAVARRYNKALIRAAGTAGIPSHPWLVVPAFGQPVP